MRHQEAPVRRHGETLGSARAEEGAEPPHLGSTRPFEPERAPASRGHLYAARSYRRPRVIRFDTASTRSGDAKPSERHAIAVVRATPVLTRSRVSVSADHPSGDGDTQVKIIGAPMVSDGKVVEPMAPVGVVAPSKATGLRALPSSTYVSLAQRSSNVLIRRGGLTRTGTERDFARSSARWASEA